MRILTLLYCLSSFVIYGQQSKIDSLRSASQNADGRDKVQLFNDLSWQFKNSDLDSTRYYAFAALGEAKELDKGNEDALGAAYNSIANYYEAVGKMDSSEHFHLIALENKALAGDSLGMAASMNNLGILYDLTDRNDESLDYYLRALRIYEEQSDDPFQVAMVLGNVGIVLKKLKEYDRSVDYYDRALKIYQEEGSEFGETVTVGNIGSILINLGRYEESVSYSKRAEEGYRSLGYLRYMPYATHNIAIAQDSLGQWEMAEENYRSVIDQHGSFENFIELASSQNALANLLIKRKNFADARTVATQARENALKVKSYEFAVRATKTLADAETKLGNYQASNQYLNQYIIGRDSLFEAEKTKQIFELETQYETEKKEQQIALQESELAEQALINERNNILLASSGGLILLLIGLGIQGRSRLKWKNRKLLEEQKTKAREAEISAVIVSQEKERNRFARDLHDGFGQLISTLNLNLRNLNNPKDKSERERVFDASAKVLEEMYQELKNICFDLMPQTLVKQGLEAALQEFANRINISGEKHVEINVFGLEERLEDVQEVSFYRISQEWVNNILKYSDAQKITVQITKDEEEITLLIEDDGMGFDPAVLKQGKGNGWKNMNSRANLMKAELEIESNPGRRENSLILNAEVKRPVEQAEEIPA